MCHDTYSAHQGVEHDDMNVLCLGRAGHRHRAGARGASTTFLAARFYGAERHRRRLDKVEAIERETMCMEES